MWTCDVSEMRLNIYTKEGCTVKFTNITALEFKEEQVDTAVCCACKKEGCNKYVRVGRFTVLGMDSQKCQQFEHLLTVIYQYNVRYGTAFTATAHFWRHLVNFGCRQSQSLSRILRLPINGLFDAVAYKLDNIAYKLQEEDDRETF